MTIRKAIRTLFTLTKGVTKGLTEEAAGDDPIALFREWFADARASNIFLPEAITVATATRDGKPSARMMLLKGADERGFVFYTNYGSRKGTELNENPHAAIVLYWAILERQIRVEGSVGRLTAEESTAYFTSRPRGSRIGAWASRQSDVLADRATLEARVRDCEKQFGGGDVPLPEFWGGYRLVPTRIEFWQGRVNRLHDRICFTRTPDGWGRTRHYP